LNFGDVLDEWERKKKAPTVKEKQTEKQFEKKAHPLDVWLRTNPIPDKDSQADTDLAREKEAAGERRRRLRNKKPDDSIDIHGLTSDEAWIALESFFNYSHRRGLEKVLIIHGKGNHSRDKAVLKQCVREFTEKNPYAGECGQSETGGSGTTWVILK